MKKYITLFIISVLPLLSLNAQIPKNAIPFNLEGHFYFQGFFQDSIPVNILYDTGADGLFIDNLFIDKYPLESLGLKKGIAVIDGAGNSANKEYPAITSDVRIAAGNVRYTNSFVPIINLHELTSNADILVGNDFFHDKPLMINNSGKYFLQLENVDSVVAQGYSKLPAAFEPGKILVEGVLHVDSLQELHGKWLLDLGCGASMILTNNTREKINVNNKKTVIRNAKNAGVGGGSKEIVFRIDSFELAGSFNNVVVSASFNQEGALSARDYIGIIGTPILENYDIVIDYPNKALYLKRRNDVNPKYNVSSHLQLGWLDRPDITDGWLVNSLYEGGIPEVAGIEIGDIILEINGKPVKGMSWNEQVSLGLTISGETQIKVKKKGGEIKNYILNLLQPII